VVSSTGGNLLFEGKLTVNNADERKANIQTVINPLSALKNRDIRALDLGGERSIGTTSAEARAHAKDTAENPLSHDYIFFPIYNWKFQADPTLVGSAFLFQNYWDGPNQEFFEGAESPAAMPFVRVDYLLDKIFEGLEFKFANKWQVSDELKKLVLYSNHSIYHDPTYDPDADPHVDPVIDEWKTTIELKNHIPKLKTNEFVKAWLRVFALGLFPDYNKSLIELIPIRDLLRAAAKHDWTGKVIRFYSINSNKQDAPDAYTFEVEEDEIHIALQEIYDRPEEFISVLDISDVPATPPGAINVYYVENRDIYVLSGAFSSRPSRKALDYSDLGTAPTYDTNNESQISPVPLFDFFFGQENPLSLVTYDGFDYFTPPEARAFPAIYQAGTIPQLSQSNDVPFRFTMYRGMYANRDGDLYPYANGMPYDPVGNKIGDNSLHWTSPTGLYENWHREWHEMIRYGKRITATLNLSLSDYIKFSYKDKVRINHMEYFVKSMKVSFNSKGILPVQMELISVI